MKKIVFWWAWCASTIFFLLTTSRHIGIVMNTPTNARPDASGVIGMGIGLASIGVVALLDYMFNNKNDEKK